MQGRQRQGRRRVAAERFQQEGIRVNTGFTQLLLRQKAVFFIADDDRSRDGQTAIGQGSKSLDRLLEQAVLACEA